MVKIIRLVSGEEICCVLPKEQLKDKIMTIANATEPFTRRYHHLVKAMNRSTQKLPAFVERDLNNEDYEKIDKMTEQDNLDDFKKFFDMPSKKIH